MSAAPAAALRPAHRSYPLDAAAALAVVSAPPGGGVTGPAAARTDVTMTVLTFPDIVASAPGQYSERLQGKPLRRFP